MFVILFSTLLWNIDFLTQEFYKYPVTEITAYEDGQTYGGMKTVCCRRFHSLKKPVQEARRIKLILTFFSYGG
jgi:hypothetical protein